jgi:energy-coupling factor transporter ATP-binding protein EcfA2
MCPQESDSHDKVTTVPEDESATQVVRLARIRAWNLRKIAELDIQLPPNIQFLCLVGPNGGGKSTLASLLVDSLTRLTTESLRNEQHPSQKIDDVLVQHRDLSTSEVGQAGRLLAFRADWVAGTAALSRSLIVSEGPMRPKVGHAQDLAEVEEFLGVKTTVYDPGVEKSEWIWSQKTPAYPKGQEDAVARSVFLERPATRFEVPYCEESHSVVSPSTGVNYYGQRLFSVRATSGLPFLETLILDLTLDASMEKRSSSDAKFALDLIRKALARLTKVDIEWKIASWPFRRVGVGPIFSLSLLSAGEVDLLVTVGLIVGQQLYLKQKASSATATLPGGVVFVDELDAHLHPQWQELAVPLLAELFPSIQFVITTHSPFVLRSLPRDRAMVVRLPDGKKFDQDFSSWSADDILRAVFEVAPDWSNEIAGQLLELKKLAADSQFRVAAMELYFALAERSQSLRAECDRIIAVGADMSLRDAIRARSVARKGSRA